MADPEDPDAGTDERAGHPRIELCLSIEANGAATHRAAAHHVVLMVR